MKCKVLFVFFFGIVLSLLIVNTSFAGWPITVTPTIQGTVLDTTTGQPIENTIIEVTWLTSVMGIADRASGHAGHKLILTGKDGNYRIPSKVMLQPLGGIISQFRAIEIIIRHPLYESKRTGVEAGDIGRYKKEGKLKKYDVFLLSLEKKYENIDRTKMYTDKVPMQINDLSDEMTNGTYFVLANKINMSRDYLKIIFREWDEIISKYKSDEREYLYKEIGNFKKYYNFK